MRSLRPTLLSATHAPASSSSVPRTARFGAALLTLLAACATDSPSLDEADTSTGADTTADTSVPDGETPDGDAPDAADDTTTPDALPDGGDEDVPDTSVPDATVDAPDTRPDTAEPACGDGAVNGDEICDRSAPLTGCRGGERCAEDCSACEPLPQSCGDGVVSGDEVCDGSATNDGCGAGAECNASCTACEAGTAPFCGDGDVNGDEICDGTAADSGCAEGFACNATCTACRSTRPPACGDGSVNGTEVCDGSATLATGCAAPNVCNAACTACEPPASSACGNGVRDSGEVCDASALGNTGCAPRETCAPDCGACRAPAPVCGDGEVNGAEACDPTAARSGCAANERCRADCSTCEPLPAACGNGVLDAGEACDRQGDVSTGCDAASECALDCSGCRPLGCGDGVVAGGERCDGSAATSGCGEGALCSATCDTCSVCGDYAIEGDEQCDYDGVFGDPYACGEGLACAACRCVPERVRLVEGEAWGSSIPGMLSLRIEVEDRSGFASFAAVFFDADGRLLSFFNSRSDVLLESRRTPEDDPVNFTWVATMHFLAGIPEDAAFLWLVLYDEEGVASNPLVGRVPGIFSPLPVGATCYPTMAVTGCVGGGLCDEGTRTCAAGDESLAAFDLGGEAVGAAGLRLDMSVLDFQGDFLPYWMLAVYDLDLDLIGAAFRPFDAAWSTEDDFEWTTSWTVTNWLENTGIPLSNVGAIGGVVFDRSGFDLFEPVLVD